VRVQVTPERVELSEDNAVEVFVTVHNTGSLIGGYHLRVLGADPSWVVLETENLSLFPDTADTVRALIRIPPGVAAGERRIAVQVRELTPPQAIAIAEVELVVPPSEALKLTLTPMTVVGSSSGTFGVILENSGNTTIVAPLAGTDAEDVLRFRFVPPTLTLAPGDQAIADLKVKGPRRWFGSPVVRAFGIGLQPPTGAVPTGAVPTGAVPPAVPPGAVPPGAVPAGAVPPGAVPPGAVPAGASQSDASPTAAAAATPPGTGKPLASDEPLATGTLLQKPRLSRGALSLLSLLLAATVFATVITIAFSALVGQSAQDRDLAIQVAAARNSVAIAGTSTLGGTVVLLTDGAPVAGVTVELFDAAATTTPVKQTATGDDGSWKIDNLPSGSYLFRVSGAGFVQIWYPQALSASDATVITVQVGQQVTDLQVTLGGLPASVSGQVVGGDVAGAVLTVQVPVEFLPPDPTDVAAVAAKPPAGGDPGGAVLKTVPIGSDGAFEVTDIPSPRVYDLVVTKPGFATEQQRIDLAAGESRTDVQLRLRTGDGLISGTVSGPDGPLGGAVITATTGSNKVETVSLTQGDIGSFTIRGLVTPATYTVTATSPGFTPQTSTLTLADGQKLTGVQLTVARSSGSLSGTVTTLPGNEPAAGVTVTIAAGATSVQTVTQSTGTVGGWMVAGLPIPSTYTVTFSRADLQSQTVAVTLDAAGSLSSGSAASGVGGNSSAANSISVAMMSAFAVISGVVSQLESDSSTQPVGEALVSLSSGTDAYAVTSASQPADAVGQYLVGGVKPGSYTLAVSRRGTSPTSVIVTVVAGQALTYNPVLIQPASIAGTVTDRSGGTLGGLQVMLFKASAYPAESQQSTTTDARGGYRFDEVDAPQAYVVEVRSTTAGALGSATLVLAASEQALLDITVGPAPSTVTTAPVPASVPAPVPAPVPAQPAAPAEAPNAEPPAVPPPAGGGG